MKEFLTIHKTFIVDTLRFWWHQVRFNASCATARDRVKLEYVLLRKTHTLEKGLSLRQPRQGFGQQKVSALIDSLAGYWERFGTVNPGFLRYPVAAIRAWIGYSQSQGVEVEPIVRKLDNLLQQTGTDSKSVAAGVRQASRQEIQTAAAGNFASLLESRHSVRYFLQEKAPRQVVEEALRLAQLTPSACNRQGWKTHVFEGDECHNLLKWHGGCRGFEEDVHQAVLVTANQKAFLYYEMHQAYVDGGLYAMNLINALHSLGLGTIPLSCGFKQRKLNQLRQLFDIPEEEVPVVIVGFGQLPETFKVAISERKPVVQTNRFH